MDCRPVAKGDFFCYQDEQKLSLAIRLLKYINTVIFVLFLSVI
jgi:hypothetical protein